MVWKPKHSSPDGRFLLFAGDNYYPSGGWGDFRARYASVEDAKEEVKSPTWSWWHVVDMATLEEVASGGLDD